MLATISLALLEPRRKLLADVRDRRAGLLEGALHAVAVVRPRALALVLERRLLAAPQIVAADDPVVVALAHPVEQLADALDRQRVRDLQVLQQPRQAVEPGAGLRVVHALLDEGV